MKTKLNQLIAEHEFVGRLVDRQQFIDCCRGDLMVRDSRGVITHLGDAATAAVEAAERGETILLTVRGVVVSRIVNGVEEAVDYPHNVQSNNGK